MGVDQIFLLCLLHSFTDILLHIKLIPFHVLIKSSQDNLYCFAQVSARISIIIITDDSSLPDVQMFSFQRSPYFELELFIIYFKVLPCMLSNIIFPLWSGTAPVPSLSSFCTRKETIILTLIFELSLVQKSV